MCGCDNTATGTQRGETAATAPARTTYETTDSTDRSLPTDRRLPTDYRLHTWTGPAQTQSDRLRENVRTTHAFRHTYARAHAGRRNARSYVRIRGVHTYGRTHSRTGIRSPQARSYVCTLTRTLERTPERTRRYLRTTPLLRELARTNRTNETAAAVGSLAGIYCVM